MKSFNEMETNGAGNKIQFLIVFLMGTIFFPDMRLCRKNTEIIFTLKR